MEWGIGMGWQSRYDWWRIPLRLEQGGPEPYLLSLYHFLLYSICKYVYNNTQRVEPAALFLLFVLFISLFFGCSELV
jgi:hypothetical protein